MNEKLPEHVSEASTCKDILAPYCKGFGMDMGFGGYATSKDVWTFDSPTPYTCVGKDRQILRGDCRRLPFLCDGALDYFVTHHLLEDFSYDDLVNIIVEWRRCLTVGGLLIVNCPDQKKFLNHCKLTGQGVNLSHKETDFSLENFKSKVLARSGLWEEVFVEPNHGPYSWLTCHRKK